MIEAPEKCAAIFYISKLGDDRWSGTIPEPKEDESDGPFATLDRARDAVQQRRKNIQCDLSSAQVLIRKGIYTLSTTFELSKLDSGTSRYPVIYQPYKNEKVHIIGGLEISGFSPVMDQTILSRIQKPFRDKIFQISLSTQGVNNFGEIPQSGHAGKSTRSIYPTSNELFFENRPMKLARWPNEGWVHVEDTPTRACFAARFLG
ncbi:MAG: hypothetical protein ACYTFM_13225 [Planctomycetota bacterium]